MQRSSIVLGATIPFVLLWGLSQMQARPLENPLPAPAPLVPELVLPNPFAELPVNCMSHSAPLLQKGAKLPAAQMVNAIPLSAILSIFGVLDYSVCDASSGVMIGDGLGDTKLSDDWRFYNA